MKKKILFIHHAAGVGGAPISMIETIKALNKNTYDVEVLLLKNSVVTDLLKSEGIKYSVEDSVFYTKYYQFFPHIMPQYFKWYQIFRIFLYSLRWILSRYYFSFKLMSKFDYDIVHLNSSVLSDFLCAGSRYGKAIIHIREPLAEGYFGFRRKIIKQQIRNYADHVIAISRDNSERLGVSEKTTVVYNFTDIRKPAVGPETLVLDRIIYLGGDLISKGFLTVVDALDYLDPSVKILFCGNYSASNVSERNIFSKCKNYLYSYLPHVKKVNEAKIKIHNHPNAKLLGLSMNVPVLLREATFLINPFLIEHFSRPVIEAFANRKPVIATNVEGMSEIIDHGVDGFLVERDDPISLANAINYLNANPDLIRKMGVSGYQKAQEKFSSRNVDEIENIYALLCGI